MQRRAVYEASSRAGHDELPPSEAAAIIITAGALLKIVQGGLGHVDLAGQVDVDGLQVGGKELAGGRVDGVDGGGEVFGVDAGVGEDGMEGGEGVDCGVEEGEDRVPVGDVGFVEEDVGRASRSVCVCGMGWFGWEDAHSSSSDFKASPSFSFQSAMATLAPYSAVMVFIQYDSSPGGRNWDSLCAI